MLYDGESGIAVEDAGLLANADVFERLNGIFVLGDLLFVVERDAAKVSVLRLPSLEMLGSFGADELKKPYGLWLHQTAPGRH